MWLIYSSVQSYFQKSVYDGFYFLLLPTLIKTIWLWSETGNIALKLLNLALNFFKAVFCFLGIRHCNENCLMFPKVIKYLPIFYRKKPLSYSLIKTNVDSQKKVTLFTYLTSKPLRRPWRFHLYLEWINKTLDSEIDIDIDIEIITLFNCSKSTMKTTEKCVKSIQN